MYAISVAMNDNAAVVQLRGWLIDTFRELLLEKPGLLKELGVDADVSCLMSLWGWCMGLMASP